MNDPLRESLDAVRSDDEATVVPAHIEDLVMQEWDRAFVSHRHERRSRSAVVWLGVVAASLLAGMALWVSRGGEIGTPAEPTATNAVTFTEGVLEDASAQSLVTQAAPGEDPATLQYVQLSIRPSVLSAYGFPVADPAGDRPVQVEVLVGLDGVPRAIRHVTIVQETP